MSDTHTIAETPWTIDEAKARDNWVISSAQGGVMYNDDYDHGPEDRCWECGLPLLEERPARWAHLVGWNLGAFCSPRCQIANGGRDGHAGPGYNRLAILPTFMWPTTAADLAATARIVRCGACGAVHDPEARVTRLQLAKVSGLLYCPECYTTRDRLGRIRADRNHRQIAGLPDWARIATMAEVDPA